MSAQDFAAELGAAEERLRACGLTGRRAYGALCRHLARRLGVPSELWIEGPDAPAAARLDRIPLTAELDLFGLAYERFFPELLKGEKGQFFTPQPLVELMADLARVKPGDRVLDPTCGSGAFLVVAHARGADVDGIEIDPELVALCRINLKLHGANPRAVRRGDLYRDAHTERWDVVLANPPFSMVLDEPELLDRYELARGKRRLRSDVAFVEAAWGLLRPGGRMVAVLPYSVLANDSFADLRSWIDARFVRQAVVSLPEGVFRPFGGAASRAVIVALQRRPAELRPWVSAVVTQPGYDPTRKVYRRTEPDELALLRIQLAGGSAPTVPSSENAWLPQAHAMDPGIAADRERVTLGALAPACPGAVRPSETPGDWFTEIDLADVDKQTGEVTGGRALKGASFKGFKSRFDEGDLLFARIRPQLNNVVMVQRPDPSLPRALCGSSEWVRLRPVRWPHFVLLAARSCFVRAQLQATGGQTRPRVSAREIPRLQVPAPSERAQAALDRVVGGAMAERLAARRRLDAAADLYARWGRGELDDASLISGLDALDGATAQSGKLST